MTPAEPSRQPSPKKPEPSESDFADILFGHTPREDLAGLTPVDLKALMCRVAALESRLPVALDESAPITVHADPDQLEQLLINLVRNAVDAALETRGSVRAGWSRASHMLELWIEDEGPGLQNTANLFVPFFTTKAGGSGIGLTLSRQIAEAHGGSLVVDNRADRRGVRAMLRLPL